jgi:hypothetical protein
MYYFRNLKLFWFHFNLPEAKWDSLNSRAMWCCRNDPWDSSDRKWDSIPIRSNCEESGSTIRRSPSSRETTSGGDSEKDRKGRCRIWIRPLLLLWRIRTKTVRPFRTRVGCRWRWRNVGCPVFRRLLEVLGKLIRAWVISVCRKSCCSPTNRPEKKNFSCQQKIN